ncbi:MAG: radical SAM protein [Butyrivibrio sp.]|nr:radical SAM protein [Butyrivibrio sp.]
MENECKDPTPGGQRQALAKALPLRMPYLIQIFPVYACNFKCEYCIHSLDRSMHGYISHDTMMPWDIYKKVIDDIRDTGERIKMLRFAAIGEPLLHLQIAEMVAYARESGIADSVDIVTNGSLLTRELSDRLIDAGLSKLRISLEGLSADEYREHTSAAVDLEKMVENIRYFFERCRGTQTTMYIKIIDYMVQSKEQQDRFMEMFSPITHSIAIEHLTPTIEEIDYDKVSHGMKTDKPQNGTILLDSQICPQPFYMMQVNPDGNVVPCCSMKYPCILGNVREESVQDIWLGENYRSFQRNMLEGVDKAAEVCGKCILYRYDMHAEDRLDADAGQLKNKY